MNEIEILRSRINSLVAAAEVFVGLYANGAPVELTRAAMQKLADAVTDAGRKLELSTDGRTR